MQLEELKALVKIEDVIRHDVTLKGNSYSRYLYPVSKEHRGLVVMPQIQAFKHYKVGYGGDVFAWFVNFHSQDFRQAMESVAKFANVPLDRLPKPQARPVLQLQPQAQPPAKLMPLPEIAQKMKAGELPARYTLPSGVVIEYLAGMLRLEGKVTQELEKLCLFAFKFGQYERNEAHGAVVYTEVVKPAPAIEVRLPAPIPCPRCHGQGYWKWSDDWEGEFLYCEVCKALWILIERKALPIENLAQGELMPAPMMRGYDL